MMTAQELYATADRPTPPPGLSPLLTALWWEAHGDWGRAHALAQEVETREGAWVHAYLHRAEGDLVNARYWYQRAGKERADGALREEWSNIVEALLGA